MFLDEANKERIAEFFSTLRAVRPDCTGIETENTRGLEQSLELAGKALAGGDIHEALKQVNGALYHNCEVYREIIKKNGRDLGYSEDSIHLAQSFVPNILTPNVGASGLSPIAARLAGLYPDSIAERFDLIASNATDWPSDRYVLEMGHFMQTRDPDCLIAYELATVPLNQKGANQIEFLSGVAKQRVILNDPELRQRTAQESFGRMFNDKFAAYKEFGSDVPVIIRNAEPYFVATQESIPGRFGHKLSITYNSSFGAYILNAAKPIDLKGLKLDSMSSPDSAAAHQVGFSSLEGRRVLLGSREQVQLVLDHIRKTDQIPFTSVGTEEPLVPLPFQDKYKIDDTQFFAARTLEPLSISINEVQDISVLLQPPVAHATGVLAKPHLRVEMERKSYNIGLKDTPNKSELRKLASRTERISKGRVMDWEEPSPRQTVIFDKPFNIRRSLVDSSAKSDKERITVYGIQDYFFSEGATLICEEPLVDQADWRFAIPPLNLGFEEGAQVAPGVSLNSYHLDWGFDPVVAKVFGEETVEIDGCEGVNCLTNWVEISIPIVRPSDAQIDRLGISTLIGLKRVSHSAWVPMLRLLQGRDLNSTTFVVEVEGETQSTQRQQGTTTGLGSTVQYRSKDQLLSDTDASVDMVPPWGVFRNAFEGNEFWTVECVVLGTAAYSFRTQERALEWSKKFASGKGGRRQAESDPDCIGRTVHSKHAKENFQTMLRATFGDQQNEEY